MTVDITKFSDRADVPMPGALNKQWWKLTGDELAQSLTQIINFLHQHQGGRLTQQLISARLYGNLSIMGLNGLTFSRVASVQSALKDRISYNVVQSAVDTITSKIGKNKPKPLFLTEGGDYKIQRRAKKLDKFVDGVFYENDTYKLGLDVFRDGVIWGDGIIHCFEHYDRVKHERVLASELYVDEVEGFYGEPRQLHRVKNIDREVLLELFPNQAKQIKECDCATPDNLGGYENISDVLTVRESWHLPSGPEATDGLRAITLQNGTLGTDDWDKPVFPFARFQWSKRLFGYWGQGGAEQIQNIQLEINKLLWVIQRSMHLAGSFKVLLENGSKIVKEHLNNDIGAIIAYTGTPPQYITPPIVPQEIYQHLLTLKNAAFEQFGISQLSASAQKPAGLNSGKALREYNDIESDRFMSVGQAYERLYLDLAKLSIATAKDIYDRKGKKYEVKVPGKKFVETIDWKDIDLEDDEYVMKVYPVSSLPNDPAGRLQTVQEYAQAGYISPRTARKLLDFPDLEQIEDLQNSAEDYLHEVFEKMVEDGEYTAPEPYDDLQLAHELALEYYAQGKNNGLEEEKLDLLRQFMEQLQTIAQAAMQPPQLGAGAPQAQPQPTPQSDLVQNVPGQIQWEKN